MSLDCFCDYDQPSVWRSSKPRARKDHKCYECGSAIRRGEQHEYVFGIWEGDASSFRTCERCLEIRQWVKNNVPCFCWAHGNMIDDAREAVEAAVDRAPDETVGLRFGLVRRIEMARKARRALTSSKGDA